MFRQNIASAIADLPLLTDGNGKTGSTVTTVGENPSAKGCLPEVKGCLPEVPLLTKIPLIYYEVFYCYLPPSRANRFP
jgi:hypothetical protein